MQEEVFDIKIRALLNQIGGLDELYFEKVYRYMEARSWLAAKEKVNELLYAILADYAKAHKDGLSAKEFFGEPPEELAATLLNNLPKLPLKSKLASGAVAAGMLFLLFFSSNQHVAARPLFYLLSLILVGSYAFFLPRIIFSRYMSRNKGLGCLYYIAGISVLTLGSGLRDSIAPYEVALPITAIGEICSGLAVWLALISYLYLKKRDLLITDVISTLLFILGTLLRLPACPAWLVDFTNWQLYVLGFIWLGLSIYQRRRLTLQLFPKKDTEQ